MVCYVAQSKIQQWIIKRAQVASCTSTCHRFNIFQGFLSTYRNRTESEQKLITNPGYDEKYSEETTE